MSEPSYDVESEFECDDDALLLKAEGQKGRGNDLLKTGNLSEAEKAYQEGISSLEKMLSKTSDKYRICFSALHLNMALVKIKKEEWFEGVQMTSKVIDQCSDNDKARLRRGVCHSRLGNLDEAKNDLMTCIKNDPSNHEARRELQAVQQKIKDVSKRQKAAFSGMFGRVEGLYSDREAELRRQREIEAAKEAALRMEYEKEMMDHMDDTRPTFEEWRKSKEESAKSPSNSTKPSTESVPKQTETKGTAMSSDALDLDEEDRKLLEETKRKGYCYFRRELTEEEKRLRDQQHVPQKIEESTSASSPTGDSSKRGVSEWNATGITFEEKDTSKWCVSHMSSLLSKTEWESEGTKSRLTDQMSDLEGFAKVLDSMKNGSDITSLDALLSKVHWVKVSVAGNPDVKGEAQLMVVRGQRRWYYELSTKVDWKINIGGISPEQNDMPIEPAHFEGAIHIEDLSSNVDRQTIINKSKITYKQRPTEKHQAIVDMALRGFMSNLASQVDQFEKDYQQSQ